MSAAGAASLGLSACVSSSGDTPRIVERPEPEPGPVQYSSMYGAVTDAGYDIPAVPIEKINPRYYRQEVADPTGERPGTIVVDTANHFLYLVRERGRAMRYGVGLGRAGFEWAGRAEIKYKQQWPRWFPPAEMIDRRPRPRESIAQNTTRPMTSGLAACSLAFRIRSAPARALHLRRRQGHALPRPRLA
ncbi:L,D-transpeptidase [Nitratireductor rhodophyticola]|uniref:L,D-transpeptidase n=1 Tax=Nitratireductor rhodophyticola TaxID=2854036 RepID=UPI003BAB72C3